MYTLKGGTTIAGPRRFNFFSMPNSLLLTASVRKRGMCADTGKKITVKISFT